MANPQQQCDYVTLRDAIRSKKTIKARNLILNNVDVNNRKFKCNTPLHWAVTRFEDLEIITMLLDRGADIHAKNHNREKPLNVAIYNNRTEAALLFITKGALVGEDLEALLLEAIKKKNYTIFKSLIDNRTQSNQAINFNILFANAISRGCSKILEYILPCCQFSKPSEKYIPRKFVIKLRYKNCVKLLLKHNFTIHPTSHQDEKFIWGAVENGYLPIVLQLLKLGIDVNLIHTSTGLNLLKIACLNKHYEIVENLLKHNAVINVITPTDTKTLKKFYHNNIGRNNYSFSSTYHKKNFSGITCLHIAVLNSDLKMIELLLRYDAKIIDDPTLFTITCIAVQNNDEEIVRLFLDRGVNVHTIDLKRKTLLHFCVDSSDDGQDSKYNIAELLLKKGATKQLQIPGNSFMFKAIDNEHCKIVKLFLGFNPNIQYINSHGDTSLHKAIEKDFDVKFIRILLKLNAPVDVMNNNFLTPLMVACKTQSKNQLEIIEVLLQYNANVNYGCQTPLHFVCKYKNDMTESIIQLLLYYDANIEAVDEKGWTPLFAACHSNNDVAVKCLLNRHADANRTDLENLTPLHIAVQYYYNDYNDNLQVIKILLQHKVNIHYIDKQGKSIIHFVVENKRNTELIKFFAHTQVNFNSVDKKGNTPLHIAVKNKCVDVTKNLIKYGADINILNKKKRTSLQEAIELMSDLRNQLEQFRRRQLSERLDFHNEVLDSDIIEMEVDQCQKIIKILKTQAVKLKAAGLKVKKQNMNDYEPFDQNNIDYKIDVLKLEVDCEQEIEKMRMKKIGISIMTFYDLLKKNIHTISRFAKNKIIKETLELEVFDEKFPLYIDIVRSQFRNARLRYKLMKPAEKYFTSNINHRLPDECVYAVFSYLTSKEINTFIKAVEFSDD